MDIGLFIMYGFLLLLAFIYVKIEDRKEQKNS